MFNASSSLNPYGVYICTIEQSIKNASLLLQESGELLYIIFRNGMIIIMTDFKHAARFYIEISSQQGFCQEWLVITNYYNLYSFSYKKL